jgi:hypothetical protein
MKPFSLYLESAKSEFAKTKNLGLKAIQVLSDNELNLDIHESNSIAIIVKHLHGNMQSRWTNIFTEDGEKPNRNRDEEFLSAPLSKAEIETLFLEGWAYLENALANIEEPDFEKPVFIRKEPLSLLQAINRQISHYAYHVGQIVMLSKQFKGSHWDSLSIPKGQSNEFLLGTYSKT